MRSALVNARILLPAGIVAGQVLLIQHGRIEAVTSPDDPRCRDANVTDLGGQLLAPGFIDVQVNGGDGILFNDEPSVRSIQAIGAAHRRYGTTGFLPTVISDDLDTIGRAIAAVQAAIDAGVPGVLGIHIEGPFLNSSRRGVHDARHLRPLDVSLVPLLCSLRGGRTLLTLAPEMTSPDVVAQLVAAGVIVAAGHSNATFAEIAGALKRGLRGFTHLFNAMSPLTPREPGMVGAALYDDDSWSSIIVDGQHVDPVTLKIALRCKRHDRFLLVTDAMPVVGTSSNTFKIQGRRIQVVDGACRDEHGTLAGTALDMALAVRNAIVMLGLELSEAVRMASEYPAQFLGIADDLGHVAAGCRANLVLLDDKLAVQRTWIDGANS